MKEMILILSLLILGSVGFRTQRSSGKLAKEQKATSDFKVRVANLEGGPMLSSQAEETASRRLCQFTSTDFLPLLQLHRPDPQGPNKKPTDNGITDAAARRLLTWQRSN